MVIRHAPMTEGEQKTETDDFTVIHGIGPGIETRLHNAGIQTYGDLAEQTVDRIAEILKSIVGMTALRISEQDWLGQAKDLAQTRPSAPTPASDETRQHYEMFSVELLLDEMNQVRRTKIIHSQSKVEVNWAGWNVQRLLDTIVQHAGLRQIPLSPTESERRWAKVVDPQAPKTEPSPSQTAGPVRGELFLKDLEVRMEGMTKPSSIIKGDQNYRVNLTLDMSKVDWPSQMTLEYKATVYARDPGGATNLTIGTARGTISPAEKLTIQIDGSSLPVGVYRLEAVVALANPTGQTTPGSGLMAMLEAGLLQVY